MAFKATLLFCAQALFIQGLTAKCIGAFNNIAAEEACGCAGLGWDAASWGSAPLSVAPYAATGMPVAAANYANGVAGYSPIAISASNGGGFLVRSISPIAPTGLRVSSENTYDGLLAVSGALPFLSAVALEGSLPTVGAGDITYACGNGNVAMLTEEGHVYSSAGPAGLNGPAGPLGYGAGYGPFGYSRGPFGAGIAGPLSYNEAGFGGCGCGRAY